MCSYIRAKGVTKYMNHQKHVFFLVWQANNVKIMAKMNQFHIQNAVFGIFLSGFSDVKHPFSV